MNIAWAGFILAVAVGVPGVYFGFRTVRSATIADQQRAHDALNAKLDKARETERDLCRLQYEPQITSLQRELDEMTNQRDYYRGSTGGRRE